MRGETTGKKFEGRPQAIDRNEVTRHAVVRNERGSILVLALLVTVFILGVGLTVMWFTSSGTRITANLTRRQEALYAAETGLDRARVVLAQPTADWPTLLTGCGGSMDDPADKGMVLCDFSSGTPQALEFTRVIAAGSVTESQAPSMAGVTYTLYIRNDPMEYQWCNGVVEPGETADIGDCDGDGTNDINDTNIRRYADQDRRVVVRAEGNGKDGLSQVAVEVVMGSGVSAVSAGGYSQKGGRGGGGSNATPSASIPVP